MIKPKEFKDEDKISHAKRKMTKQCPHCGRKMHFYAFEKMTKSYAIGVEDMFLKTKKLNMITG